MIHFTDIILLMSFIRYHLKEKWNLNYQNFCTCGVISHFHIMSLCPMFSVPLLSISTNVIDIWNCILDDEDDENSYEVLRKAVKEYWISMREYYKAVITRHT